MTSNLDEKGLRSIFDKYDVFFIDIWGVLHNGLNLFQKSLEVLEKLDQLKPSANNHSSQREIDPRWDALKKLKMK